MVSRKSIQILIFTILFYYYSSPSLAANNYNNNPTFNVETFGAKSGGKSDCTKAFLSAWGAACASLKPATIYVPSGMYLLRTAKFTGNLCKNTAITIRIDGILVAPSDYNVLRNTRTWLKFDRVTGVSIYGGTLDAQGAKLWDCKSSGKSCPKGATSLAFYNSRNIIVKGLSSLNSQMFHVLFDGCQNVNVVDMRIRAPENSPNTDGIHLQQSSGVTIMKTQIGTGDDCVSIGPGNSNLWIENLQCGPGHGISIGSLGWDLHEAGVQNVTVKTVTFTRTENGLRMKTWATPSNGFVRNVRFQHAFMVDVQNPIIIDQNYCPDHNEKCPNQASGVKISDVIYQDIHGTSATQVAVKFNCSTINPCSGIKLDGVNLSYRDKPAIASCANADGTAAGVVKPTSCL